ncbi:Phage SPO1 DNA polymerase-related protein [Nitrosococcus oceani ATCC 19707]|uniref:Type-4 uracil-DNA glycosylase n=2 Tax=Nitrosococcus oceani TaxID=1229 RepID=Q3JC56_NITOC|nr:uracil-DNA glycosylase [Nitrosococcus oceani]ABA57590.1 Phage SPO1 DNA polymerase-related protein [Nitrosococcus oceani ATCC 19707]EDZ66756.1 uracil-DNA glycosylase, family 4 [Nitrosococcus oceani AFC27]KFI20093.1 DNA polymerase [Nitrosococcus oceani C-27]GEM20616.1 uracil-DNA glycosylase [Nitrosococcus oceani]
MDDFLEKAVTLQELKWHCERSLGPEVPKGEKLVFGEGPSPAEIMIIGEAPGVQEAKTGRPFVGSSGKLLTQLLHQIGLKREHVYISNILKTHPPGNRKPYRSEIKRELPFLLRQIELLQPQLLILLGATALQALLDPKAKITALRGQWVEVKKLPTFVTYHPAAALRDETKKTALEQDFAVLQRHLESR